jgi:hypothetical protein
MAQKNNIYCATDERSDTSEKKRGAKALYEVNYFQKSTDLLVPKASLERLIKEIIQRDLEKVSCFT